MSSDARRDADRWLLWYAGGEQLTEDGRKNAVRTATLVIRALLASEPAKAPFVSRNEEWGLRPDFTTAGVPAPPAGAEPAKGACADCGGCGGLGWIPAGDEQLGCIDCNGKGTIAPPPPSDAVREAAEVLDSLVNRVWSMTPEEAESAGLPTIAKVLRASKRLLSALAASPATVTVPDDAAVREAAEVVRTILTAHDARLSESGVLTYGPPSKGTGFVAAIQWLRRYDAARGGE